MRKLRALLLTIAAASLALACDNPEKAEVVHVRLLTSLASDTSKRGSEFSAVATSPMFHCGQVLIPTGSLIKGTVTRASKVGLGVIRERAALELNFNTYESPDGAIYRLGAQLVDVDNAREEVTAKGQIKGILAASSSNRLVRGIWFRPTMDLLPHTMMGLTGASEKLWSGFGLGPEGAAALYAARLILFRFPEPEISLPAGTDMQVRVTSLPEDIPAYPAPQLSDIPDDLAQWLRSQPFDVSKNDRALAEDIVNFAFIGTRDQLSQAFENAGWDPTDPRSSRTFSRVYNAYVTVKAYPTAPVSTLYYQGETPDLVFQKSLNTLSKRHHIRVWSAGTFAGNEVWLGAATHDIGVSMRRTPFAPTHKIDLQIDSERDKVIEDLAFTECVEAPGFVDRADAQRGGNSSISTDGRIAVLTLRDCDPSEDDPSPLKRPGKRVNKMARRMMLETRQYLMRDNVYYYGFEGVRKMVHHASHPNPNKPVDLAAAAKPGKRSAQSNNSFSWTSPVTSAWSSPTNTFTSDLIPNSGR